jgi:hypothetical protein
MVNAILLGRFFCKLSIARKGILTQVRMSLSGDRFMGEFVRFIFSAFAALAFSMIALPANAAIYLAEFSGSGILTSSHYANGIYGGANEYDESQPTPFTATIRIDTDLLPAPNIFGSTVSYSNNATGAIQFSVNVPFATPVSSTDGTVPSYMFTSSGTSQAGATVSYSYSSETIGNVNFQHSENSGIKFESIGDIGTVNIGGKIIPDLSKLKFMQSYFTKQDSAFLSLPNPDTNDPRPFLVPFGSESTNKIFGGAFNAVIVTVSGVPEPATWAMMIFGLAGVGMMLRQQRRHLQFIASCI